MSSITRREAITVISQSALSGTLALVSPQLGTTPAYATPVSRPRSIIWIWPDGGAPQTDIFDPKPNSMREIRGTLRALEVPGMTGFGRQPMLVTECFERTRQQLRHCTVLRARRASFTFHLEAMASVLDRVATGHNFLTRHAAATIGSEYVYGETPGVINGFNYRRDAFIVQRSMEITWDNQRRVYRSPTLPRLTGRGEARRDLVRVLDAASPNPVAGPVAEHHDRIVQTAYNFMARSLNVTLPEALIARYGGNNPTAIGMLTIRELCRLGFSGALLFRDGDWDTHTNSQRYVRERGPRFDRAFAELIVDVHRGVLGDVLLVYCGEFGRTPRLNSSGGRDHYQWHTAILCGSRIRQGFVHGETNSYGEGATGQVDDRTFLEILAVATAQQPDSALLARLPDIFIR